MKFQSIALFTGLAAMGKDSTQGEIEWHAGEDGCGRAR